MRVAEEDFGRIYSAHAAAVFGLALRLCGDRDWAEEATAEAFASVLVRWRRGGIDDVGAYLRRAVVNQVNRRFRRRVVERRWLRLSWEDRGLPDGETRSADALDMARALGRLTPRQRAVVVLRYYEQLSVAEAAAALGCSQGTVKSQTSKALTRLGTILQPAQTPPKDDDGHL